MSPAKEQPKLIAHYRIVRHLGSGGMGEVFLAEDTRLDRSVALKLLPKEMAEDASRRKRFLVEAKAASALNHSSVCTIYEVGETAEGQPFIAMEYLEGQTLEALARHRRLDLREIAGIGVQVADALEAARQHQVVHRDIKPGNVVVLNPKSEIRNPQLQVKVVDFGLAKRLDQASDASVMTQEGAIVGTPNYLSPELALGREVDSRSDIFSLGVVLYELAARQNPFAGESFGETVNNILNKNPEPLKPWNPNVTPEFERIVRKCLEKDGAKRYATPAQLRDDLAELQAGLQSPHSASQRLWAVAVVVVVLSFITFGGIWLYRSKPAAQPLQQKSVAVLPFVNMSADKNDEYLSDGLTEELLNVLAKIPGLRVPGRSSSFAYKGRNEQGIFRKVGEQLHVGAVLEGSVRKAGNRLRITAQLINVADGFHLWSDTYDRDMTNIFAVQSEVAQQVASALKLQLGMADVQRLQSKPTENLAAYELYLKGRFYLYQYTGPTSKQAIHLLNEAIVLDPAFAKAHAGLAAAYAWVSSMYMHPREAMPLAKLSAERALELDDSLAEAHHAYATIKWWGDWDFGGAEREFRRALDLNPNEAQVYCDYSDFLNQQSRFDEALKVANRGMQLSPGDGALHLVWVYSGLRRYDQAVAFAEQAVQLNPSFSKAHENLASALLEQGRFEEAIAESRKALELAGEREWYLLRLAVTLARSGKPEEARKSLDELNRLPKEKYLSPVSLAELYQALGERERAFQWLQKAYEDRCDHLLGMKVMPEFDSFRADPRFTELLKKVEDGGREPFHSRNASGLTNALPRITSLAVKPLDDFSGDTNNAYLSDGMTEALCSALGNISALRVPGRASVMRYKGGQKSIQEMAQELKVDAIVEGSVQRNGNRIRVTAQLIEAATDRHLWSTNYNRDLSDFFVVQDELAAAIASEIQVRLTPEDRRRLTRAQPVNREALEAYLLGMRHLWQWSEEGYAEALRYFQKAIQIDPNYAPAHAGAALAYEFLAFWSGPPTEMLKCKQAAQRAIELDPFSVDAYLARGWARMSFDWDWPGAESDFRRGLELSPNSSLVLDGYNNYLVPQGRLEEAVAMLNKALELDPLLPGLHSDMGASYYYAGQPDRAIAHFLKALEFDSKFLQAHFYLGWCYLFTGKPDEAMTEFKTSLQLSPDWPWAQAALGYAYGVTGHPTEAKQVLTSLAELARKRYVTRFAQAFVHLGLGQKDVTLDWLEKACQEQDGYMTLLKTDPVFAPLRSEPRFQALLRKVGLDK